MLKKQKLLIYFYLATIIIILYLIFSTFLTPLALNKSRTLLSKDGFNSTFLPTIRVQQFSDSFQGFTFLVKKRIDNEIKNVFMHDKSNVLKSLTTNQSNKNTTTIVAEEGLVQEKKMILFNGSILTTNTESLENNIIKFQQLNIDLKNLQMILLPLLNFKKQVQKI